MDRIYAFNFFHAIVFILTLTSVSLASAETKSSAKKPHKSDSWTFAVSGDSRNCGDLIMPAIANDANKHAIDFYWHLGDNRWGTNVDQDMAHDPKYKTKPLAIDSYLAVAWDDFIENQIQPFLPTDVYLTIGNHEMENHTHAEYIEKFKPWIDARAIRVQRISENIDEVHSYGHWQEHGVDFISVDNASTDEFNPAQMKWIRNLMAADEKNKNIKAIVMGMHEALPGSLSEFHSMGQSGRPLPLQTGREVYQLLLHAQNVAHKKVYTLASHSHFYMSGIFNTDYWRTHGGVLPGWIIGTAGAARYPLPADAKDASEAKTKIYGYLLATASKDGTIAFVFNEIKESDIPKFIRDKYGPELVRYCIDENMSDHLPGAERDPHALPTATPKAH